MISNISDYVKYFNFDSKRNFKNQHVDKFREPRKSEGCIQPFA